MTVCWADPLEQYGGTIARMTDGAWAEIDAVHWSLSTANPRTGLYALRGNGAGGGAARHVYGAAKTVLGYACALYMANLPSSEFNGVTTLLPGLMIHQYRDPSNIVQVSVGVGTDGRVIVWRGGFYADGIGSPIGVKLAESGQCLHAQSYDHVESKVGIDPTDGFVEVRVNGVTVINVTGVNTDLSGAGTASQVVTQVIGSGSVGTGVGSPGTELEFAL